MQARNCAERVLKLKEWRITNGKTVDQCVDICGNFPSESTIRKVLSKNGEKEVYRETTIAAMEQALLGFVYMPQISIPVEDAVRAQEAVANEFAGVNKRQSILIAQQKANLRVRNWIIAVLFICDIAVLLYDRFKDSVGFYRSDSEVIWIIQVVLLVMLLVIVGVYAVKTKLRNKELAKHEQM